MTDRVECQTCPLRHRRLFTAMTEDEVDFMRRFKTGERRIPRGTALLRQGEGSPQLFTVLAGMATRSVLLEDGRRQVINFVFPGDFVGLQSSLMGEARHSIEAATEMTVCTFERARVWETFRDHPGRAYDMTWIAAVEEHFLGETIATLGQRNATERMAWAMLRIWRRLAALGLAQGADVPFPFRQQDVADALGLSLVHTNKTVARLRQAGLATWFGGQLTMHDAAGLAAIAGVDIEAEERRPIM
ncbi:MAG TPA: Crp/Fnr family transcriptional regulator [Paracoccaceae bacterium]|nr:Crp/Fnr family transcriptional regulator [Paracoccaceae bacterium]HMO72058.1 Crp/Fnr family transcriptional regulator [Paracoccaceae bacterium]